MGRQDAIKREIVTMEDALHAILSVEARLVEEGSVQIPVGAGRYRPKDPMVTLDAYYSLTKTISAKIARARVALLAVPRRADPVVKIKVLRGRVVYPEGEILLGRSAEDNLHLYRRIRSRGSGVLFHSATPGGSLVYVSEDSPESIPFGGTLALMYSQYARTGLTYGPIVYSPLRDVRPAARTGSFYFRGGRQTEVTCRPLYLYISPGQTGWTGQLSFQDQEGTRLCIKRGTYKQGKKFLQRYRLRGSRLCKETISQILGVLPPCWGALSLEAQDR